MIKSVVATLDMNLRHLMHGERFPGVEPAFLLLFSCFHVSRPLLSLWLTMLRNLLYKQEREKSHLCSINIQTPNKYAHIANLCVAKAARRQGIASNMLKFAVETAKSDGMIQTPFDLMCNQTT